MSGVPTTDRVAALRQATYDDYNAARTLDFPDLRTAIAAVEPVEARSTDPDLPLADRAFHAQFAAALYSMMAVAATDGKWGRTAHLGDVRLRAQRASEAAIAAQSAEVAVLREGYDDALVRRAAARLGRWATDFAMDVPHMGLLPEAAYRQAKWAFVTAANAYCTAADYTDDSELRAHYLVDAAVTFDCAAREADALHHRQDATDYRRLAYRTSGNAIRSYWQADQNTKDPVARLRILSKAEIAAAYRATLVELRAGNTPRTQQLRTYHRDLSAHLEEAVSKVVGAKLLTSREVVQMRVLQGARIINRINDAPNRTRSQSELTNCQRVVACGLSFLDGAPIPAPSRTYGSDQAPKLMLLYERHYNARFSQMPTAGDIVDHLTRLGPGARGLVFVQRSSEDGHITVAANERGEVHFLEFQSGKVHGLSEDRADIANESNAKYRFLLTDDPVRGIAVADPTMAARRAERVLAAIAKQSASTVPPTRVPALER